MVPDSFLIGDLHTAAIVRSGGSIAWLCLPSFEGASIFASMNERDAGGSWSIEWKDASTRYLPYGAIAESTGTVDGATVTVRDFMVPRTGDDPASHVLVRRLASNRPCTLRMIFDPRPNNGRERPVFREESWGRRVRMSDRELRLQFPAGTTVARRPRKEGLMLDIPLPPNTPVDITLSYGEEAAPLQGKRDIEERTATFWKNWVTGGNFTFSRPHLVRSAITLKLLQFSPTGGILASVTDPARAVRLRDAAFALYACYVLGYDDDAARFFSFLEEAAMDAKECDGGTCDLHLPRSYTAWGQAIMGNEEEGAAFPLDVYGSLIDAYYFMAKRGMKLTPEGKDVVGMLARGLLLHWNTPGQNTHGKVMAWLGLDRAVRMADALGATPKTAAQWKSVRDEIATAARNDIDASRSDPNTYLYVLLQFLDRHDPRTKETVLATERTLAGTPASRATDFQRIAALAAVGESARAEEELRTIEAAMPAGGLIVEEGDIASPPHIGYIMAAYYLHRYASPTGDRRNSA